MEFHSLLLQVCMNELMHTVSVLTQQISVQSSLAYGESDVACIQLEICWKQSFVRPMMITGWSGVHVIKLWARDLSLYIMFAFVGKTSRLARLRGHHRASADQCNDQFHWGEQCGKCCCCTYGPTCTQNQGQDSQDSVLDPGPELLLEEGVLR